jgi:hypothetical protein
VHAGGHQKTVDPIRPTAPVAFGASAPVLYLDQGTDLPSAALPVGALPCVMKAQMRSLIAVVIAPCLVWWIAGHPRSVGRSRGAAGVYVGASDGVKQSTSFVPCRTALSGDFLDSVSW